MAPIKNVCALGGEQLCYGIHARIPVLHPTALAQTKLGQYAPPNSSTADKVKLLMLLCKIDTVDGHRMTLFSCLAP